MISVLPAGCSSSTWMIMLPSVWRVLASFPITAMQVKVGFLAAFSTAFCSAILTFFSTNLLEWLWVFLTFLIKVASFLSIVEAVAVYPNESRSLQTQYLAPVSLSRLNLYPKFWRSTKMFFFLLDRIKLARAQFSMLNLRTNWNLELLRNLCANIRGFVMLILKLGRNHAFKDKVESWPNFRPLSQLTKCIHWRNVKLTKCKLPKCSNWRNVRLTKCKLTKCKVDHM